MKELTNASQHAKMFYCRHMTPGVARYNHADIYISLDVMKKMAPSFDGKPVFIDHQEVEIQNIQDQADGYITQTFYEPLDGWLWSKMIMTTDKGIAAAQDKRMKVSNAHKPIMYGDAGTYLNLPYQKSVKASAFTHMGIVDNPRYEEALIMNPEEYRDYKKSLVSQSNELHNSKKPTGEKRMFELFKMKKETVDSVDADTMITLENGTSVSVGEMIKAVEEKNLAASKIVEEKELENNLEVEVDGVKMPVAELVAQFKTLQNEKDVADASKKIEEDKAADDAQKEKDKQLEKDKAAEEEGKKNFDELNNANENAAGETKVIQTASDGFALGQQKYGS